MIKQSRAKLFRPITVMAGLCVGAMLLGAAAVQADDPKAADKPKGWESVGSLGAALTRGNSETFVATIGLNSTRKWSKDEVILGVNAGYGENSTTTQNPTPPPNKDVEHTTTDQFIKAAGQWNHLFTERFYGGVRADGLYDDIAGIAYRFTVSPLAGYYFIKDATTFLAAEAGPGYVFEQLKSTDNNGRTVYDSNDYATLRFAERFEHKFSDKSKIWQNAEFVPEITDFQNYVFNFEIGVSAAISQSVDLRLVLQDTYRNVPPPHRKNNDLKLIAGIGYRF